MLPTCPCLWLTQTLTSLTTPARPRLAGVLPADSGAQLLVLAVLAGLLLWHLAALRRRNQRSTDELARLRQSLETSAARFRAIFNQTGAGIATLSPDGRFVQVNPQLCSLLGYSEEEFSHFNFRDLTHPDDLPFNLELCLAALNGQRSGYQLEKRYRHKDGSYLWIETTVNLVRSEQGQPDYFISLITDISSRKRAEEVLRESEERLQIIFEASQAGIILVDPQGIVTFANRRMAEMLGTTQELLTGSSYLKHVSPDDRSQGEDRMTRLVRGDLETVAHERKYRRSDGSEFWGHLSGRRLLGPDGKLQCLVGVIQDVNDRRQALDALEESERRFRELLENIQLAAVLVDRDGRVTFCNDFLLNLAGRGRDEAIGHDWVQLFVPEREHARQLQHFSQAFSGVLEVNRMCPLATRYGEERIMVWDSTLLRDERGGIIGLASIGRDVTDQRSLEAQLRQAQKMEAIGQLAGGVAHDFNNLLSVMIGLGELLRRQLADREECRVLVERILGAAEKGAFLTRGLLAMSRKQVLDMQPVDINACLAELCRLLPRIIGEDIRFSSHLDPQPLAVRADRIQLEQVFINLATNARDAMPHGGELDIATSRVVLTADAARGFGLEQPGDYACIQVKDTGHGMEKSVQERIFEPFFTTKGVQKGTGLGLSTAFGTVRQHQGSIQVESGPGAGAIFSIYLPLLEGEVLPPLNSPAETRMASGHETLLLVDDDPDVRHATCYILETSGYQVLLAADGEEALQLYRQHQAAIALVLIDVIMPGMNGREVLEEIRRLNPGIKALFISGYADDIITRKGVDESFHVLSKPFHPTTLLDKLRELLDAG